MKKIMSVANIELLRERSKILVSVIVQTAKELDMDTTELESEEVLKDIDESKHPELILFTLELVRIYESITGESANFLFEDLNENVTIH
jgi:hypothetical protein